MSTLPAFYSRCLLTIHHMLRQVGVDIYAYYLVREVIDQDFDGGFSLSPHEYTMGFLNEADIQRIGPCPDRDDFPGTVETLLQKLHEGKKCYGIKYRGEIAAFTWVNLDKITFPDEERPLQADEAYLFDLYTLPRYRRRGLGSVVRIEAYKNLRTMGRLTAYSITSIENYSSTGLKKKLNAKIIHLGICASLFDRYKIKWKITQPGR